MFGQIGEKEQNLVLLPKTKTTMMASLGEKLYSMIKLSSDQERHINIYSTGPSFKRLPLSLPF